MQIPKYICMVNVPICIHIYSINFRLCVLKLLECSNALIYILYICMYVNNLKQFNAMSSIPAGSAVN